MTEVVEHPEYEGYGASRDGKVWSRRRGEWRELKPQTDSGYQRVNLKAVGKRVSIHRLVLEVFDGPCPPGMECRHKDGDPSNNALSNLSWGTKKQNQADRKAHGTDIRGEHQHLAKLTEEEVRSIRLDERTQRAIADDYGVSQKTVSLIKRRETWQHVPK